MRLIMSRSIIFTCIAVLQLATCKPCPFLHKLTPNCC
jgi:hypothetical protein